MVNLSPSRLRTRLMHEARATLAPHLGWRLPVFSILIVVTVLAMMWPYLQQAVPYPEFVTGPHSWLGEPKARDLHVFQGLLAGVFIIYAMLNRIVGFLMQRRGWLGSSLNDALDLVMLTAMPWAGILLVQPSPVYRPLAWLLAVVASVPVLAATLLTSTRTPWLRHSHGRFAAAALLILGWFSGLALAQAASFFMPGIASGHPVVMYGLGFGMTAASVLYLGCLFFLSPGRGAAGLHWGLVAGQGFLPLLLISVLPPRPYYKGETIAYAWPWLLCVLLICAAMAGWISLARKVRSIRADMHPKRVLSPLCLSFIAIFVGATTRRYPKLWTDDFHLGEQMLPWMQWIDFGKIPFVDFVPFHGFMHLTSGALNALLFDGTISRYADTMSVLFALSACVTFLAVYRVAGARTAVICGLLTLPGTFYMSRMLFLLPAFFLLADAHLLARPIRWVAAWIGLCAFVVLYNTVTGAYFGLATLPFAVWQSWRAVRQSPRAFAGLAAVCVAVVGAGLALPLPRAIFLGYVRFIAENSFAYEATRGKPWSMSFGQTPFETGLLSNTWVYEAMRMGWVLVLLFAFFVLVYEWRRRGSVRLATVYICAGSILLLLAFKTYALQRIDPGDPSRTGSLTFVAFAGLLPVLWTRLEKRNVLPSLYPYLVAAGVMTVFMGVPDRLSLQGQFWNTFRNVEVPSYLVRVDGPEQRIPRLGDVFMEQDRWDRVSRFRKALNSLIGPRETYYDLTNHQSYYVFAHRPVPVRYAAHASTVNSLQQASILDELREDPPPVILIDPIMVVDERANFRSYYLYRHALLNFAPVKVDGFTFLVSPSLSIGHDRLFGPESVELLSSIYDREDLGSLPMSWGRSWDVLKRKAVSVQPCTLVDKDEATEEGKVAVTLHLDAPVAGKTADLLVLSLEGRRGIAQLSWKGDDDSKHDSIRFLVDEGYAVIPLGAYPSWVLSNVQKGLQLQLPLNSVVGSASLWRRAELESP